jgi:Domain of unknown function (DUF4470)
MSTQFPVYAEPFKKYTPIGKAPAVNLLQDLPLGLDARVLLLACGDAKSILYTIFCEEDSGTYNLDYANNSFPETIGHYLL